MEPSRSDRPPDDDIHGRRFLERILPELLKRAVETGVGKIAEGPESLRTFVGDLKLPKEIASYVLLQIEQTRKGLVRAVASELRRFLQRRSLGDELARALGQIAVEIKTEIRFVPGASKPGIRSTVEVKSEGEPTSDSPEEQPSKPPSTPPPSP